MIKIWTSKGIFQATSHQAYCTQIVYKNPNPTFENSVNPDQLALIFTSQFSEKKVLKILASIPLSLNFQGNPDKKALFSAILSKKHQQKSS